MIFFSFLIKAGAERGITSASLGDPLRGGLQPKNNTAALRAAFFAPVRLDELAHRYSKYLFFFAILAIPLAPLPGTKNNPRLWGEGSVDLGLAEREGFEPPEVLPSTVFKTAAIDRSAISPGAK